MLRAEDGVHTDWMLKIVLWIILRMEDLMTII